MGTRLAGVTLAAALLCVMTDFSFTGVQAQRPVTSPVVAMVAALHGDARVRTRTGERSVRLFDRLQEGDTLRTGGGADIMLVFATGTRMRLGGSGEARVRADGLVARRGELETLPSLPTVPLIAPVIGAGSAVTAVRIRAGGLHAVEPAPGETVLAEAVVLSIDSDGDSTYEYEIVAPDATVVFRQHTTAMRVHVPPSILAPGVAYRWEVTARRPTGFEARTGGAFTTLPAPIAAQRAALLAAMSDSDAESAAVLAEVDFTLGLWHPALDRFRSARAAGSTAPVLGERVATLERRLDPATERLAR